MVPLHSGNHVAHAPARLSRGLGNQLPHDHRPLFNPHHLRALGGLHPDNSVVADPTLALHRPRSHAHGKTTHRTDRNSQRDSFPCGSGLGAVVPPTRGQPFTL